MNQSILSPFSLKIAETSVPFAAPRGYAADPAGKALAVARYLCSKAGGSVGQTRLSCLCYLIDWTMAINGDVPYANLDWISRAGAPSSFTLTRALLASKFFTVEGGIVSTGAEPGSVPDNVKETIDFVVSLADEMDDASLHRQVVSTLPCRRADEGDFLDIMGGALEWRKRQTLV